MFFFLLFLCFFRSFPGFSLDLDQMAPQVHLSVSLGFHPQVLDKGNGKTRLSMGSLLKTCESPDSSDLCEKIKHIELNVLSPLVGQKIFLKVETLKETLFEFSQGHLDLNISYPPNGVTVYSQTMHMSAFQVKDRLSHMFFSKKHIKILSMSPESFETLGNDLSCQDFPEHIQWTETHTADIMLSNCQGITTPIHLTVQKDIPLVLKKGDQVSIIYETSSGLQISSQGIALKSGAIGDEVPVQVKFSKKELFAKIQGPKKVSIKI